MHTVNMLSFTSTVRRSECHDSTAAPSNAAQLVQRSWRVPSVREVQSARWQLVGLHET
jgi:hypothetical protein